MTRRLFTPGPVELSPAVVEAMSRQPISHKTAEFAQLTKRVIGNLQWLIGTSSHIAILSGSGTTAIESTIASLCVRGAPCVVLVHGRFGERLAEILTIYGANVHTITAQWGTAITPSAVETALGKIRQPHSVWLVHSETSTGVTLDLQSIAHVVHQLSPDTLLCVDAVTSVGIHELEMDAWHIDGVMTGSQKGLCAPPGLGVVALSERAYHHAAMQLPHSMTLHLPRSMKSLEESNQFPWTPPVTVMAALDVALNELRQSSRPDLWHHHRHVTKALHDGLQERGFDRFGEGSSHAVTVVNHTAPVEFLGHLYREFGITLALGQDQLGGRVFRIGTCGGVSIPDILYVLEALQNVQEHHFQL
jgi:aspartate aminotransferase-like enzyme